jgi:hypothetical protein
MNPQIAIPAIATVAIFYLFANAPWQSPPTTPTPVAKSAEVTGSIKAKPAPRSSPAPLPNPVYRTEVVEPERVERRVIPATYRKEVRTVVIREGYTKEVRYRDCCGCWRVKYQEVAPVTRQVTQYVQNTPERVELVKIPAKVRQVLVPQKPAASQSTLDYVL